VGHGPLSHISEMAMLPLVNLSLPHFTGEQIIGEQNDKEKKATHEHYTVKLILESELKDLIGAMDVDPQYIAHLIDDKIPLPDNDFFISKGVDFKPLLKQIISSDLDMDRMDYLQRDAFFCGTDYGFCDHEWILNNLQVYISGDRAFMGIGQKAVYSVENFFLGRRHMSLAVYFHSKMVVMDEMLHRYFISCDCDFRIPVSTEEYIGCTDATLFEALKKASHKNKWARRIIGKKAYEKIYEAQYMNTKNDTQSMKLLELKQFLEKENIHFIHSNSLDHIQKLYFVQNTDHFPLYIVDEFTGSAVRLRDRMSMFNRKEHILLMDRIYISPEDKRKAQKKLNSVLF